MFPAYLQGYEGFRVKIPAGMSRDRPRENTRPKRLPPGFERHIFALPAPATPMPAAIQLHLPQNAGNCPAFGANDKHCPTQSKTSSKIETRESNRQMIGKPVGQLSLCASHNLQVRFHAQPHVISHERVCILPAQYAGH